MLPGLCGMMAGLGRIKAELVASAVDTTNRSGSYTFAGLNYGEAYPGRTLVAVTVLFAITNQRLDQTSCTIGGSGTSGGDNGDLANTDGSEAHQGGAGTGVWANQAGGTSGSVVINFTPDTATAAAVFLFAVSGLASATPVDSTSTLVSPVNGAASSSDTIDISANGVLIGAIARSNNTNAITLSGVNEVASLQQTIDSVHRVAVGLSYGMNAETNRSVGFTSTGASIFGGRFSSFA